MSELLRKKWILPAILESKQPSNPSVQLLEYSKGKQVIHLQISDKFNTIEAILSVEAEAEANSRTGQALEASKGALFSLNTYHLEFDPSVRQYRLYIEKLTFIGSAYSLPFTKDQRGPFPVNKESEVLSLIQRLHGERDTQNDTEDVHLLLDLGEGTQLSEDTSRESQQHLIAVHTLSEEPSQQVFDEMIVQVIPEVSALEDMYPEQAPLGNTQGADEDWNEADDDDDDEEEETGGREKRLWQDPADDIVRGLRDALSDLEDDEENAEGATGEVVGISGDNKTPSVEDHEVSFSLFHPPQHELLSEPTPVPEEGSLTFTNTSVRSDESEKKEEPAEAPAVPESESQEATQYSPQYAAKFRKFFWPPTGLIEKVKKWFVHQVNSEFATQPPEGCEDVPLSPEFVTQVGMHTQTTPSRRRMRKLTAEDLLESSSPRSSLTSLTRSYLGQDNDSSLPASGIVAVQSQSFVRPTPNSILPNLPPDPLLLSPGSPLAPSNALMRSLSSGSSSPRSFSSSPPSSASSSSASGSTAPSISSSASTSSAPSPPPSPAPSSFSPSVSPSARNTVEPSLQDDANGDDDAEVPATTESVLKKSPKRKLKAASSKVSHAKRSKTNNGSAATRTSRNTARKAHSPSAAPPAASTDFGPNPPPLRLNGPAFMLLDSFVRRQK